MSTQKDVFLNQVTIVASALAQAMDNAQSITNVYFDRQYNVGGTNEITSGDLAAIGFSPAQLSSFITLSEQLQHLRNGQATATADYDATLNAIRRDL
jgi:hypothetical protein